MSAAGNTKRPHKSVRAPANKTGGEYPNATFITGNDDPQNTTKSTNATTTSRRSESTKKHLHNATARTAHEDSLLRTWTATRSNTNPNHRSNPHHLIPGAASQRTIRRSHRTLVLSLKKGLVPTGVIGGERERRSMDTRLCTYILNAYMYICQGLVSGLFMPMC